MSSESVRTTAGPQPVGTCEECGGRVDTHATDPHCMECGLVQEDRSSRLRNDYWDGRETVQRERHDGGLGNTRISYAGRDGLWDADFQTKRIQIWQRRVQSGTKRERNLAYVISEVSRIAAGIDLDRPTADLAKRLVRSGSEAGIFRGRDLDGFAAAAVLIACRVNERPYGRAAVAKLARNEDSTQTAYEAFVRELDVPVPPASPSTFVHRIANSVDASDEVTSRAMEIATEADGTTALNGRQPQPFAAACVYQAALEVENWDRAQPWAPCDITQAGLADAAGCCAVTVRNVLDVVEEVADGC